MRLFKTLCFICLISLFGVISAVWPAASNAAGSVLINEIAWMGTAANSADEWVELYNSSSSVVDLTGWGLYEAGGSTLIISLSGSIPAGGYYLVERTDDNSVSDIAADVFGSFAGSGLNNSGEHLVLKDSLGAVIDSVNASAGWLAGDNASKASMERKSDGTWQTNDGVTVNGKDAAGGNIMGTPKAANNGSVPDPTTPTPPAPEKGSGSVYAEMGTSTPAIALRAEAGSDVVAEMEQIIKLDASKSEGASSYKWYLGDGSVKEGTEITQIYQFPGTYLVTLEVSNGSGLALDQIKAIIFGGKAVINEFFVPSASSSSQWLEIFNPNNYGVDLAGWIMESGGKNFVFPQFVLVTPGGFLVLSQAVTGLDFYQSSSIKLRYPNGTAADEVFFEKAMPGHSASRTAQGFLWSREPTPGRPNIVLSSSLPENTLLVPRKIVARSSEELKSQSYLASFYATVEKPPEPPTNILAGSEKIFREAGFRQKLSESILFWVALAGGFGLIAGLFYVKLAKRKSQ